MLDRLQAADIEMEDVTLRLGGLAQHLEDPARRNVTVNVEGLATGVWAADPEVAQRARHPHRPLRRRGPAARRPGHAPPAPAQRQRPLDLHRRRVRGDGLHRPQRRARRRPRDLRRPRQPAARRRGRPARQRQRHPAQRRLRPHLRRRRRRPRHRRRPARPAARRRDARLSGRAVRDEAGIRTENLKIANPQLTFASNGQISSNAHRHRLRRQPRPTSRWSTRASAAR